MNKTIEFSINKKNSGIRLDVFLSKEIEHLTRSYIKKLIEKVNLENNNLTGYGASAKCVMLINLLNLTKNDIKNGKNYDIQVEVTDSEQLEELSYKEIAQIIGTNTNNIGVKIKRIKNRLEKILTKNKF